MKPGDTVAVAVVSRSIDPDTLDCLRCTKRQTRPPDEVVLVTPDRETSLPEDLAGVRVIHDEGNRSRARNIAWKASRSAIICFWESDSIFNDRWIEEVIEEFERGVDAVIDRRAVFNPRSYIERCWDKQFDIRYADYTPFSAWAFRREVLESTGGFDEALEYAEDTDLGLRLLQKGFKIGLARGAVQQHRGEPRTLRQIVARRFAFGYNKAKGFYAKHPDLFPRKKVLLLWASLFLAVALGIYGHLAIIGSLILLGYIAMAFNVYRQGRGAVPLSMVLGIALIRILGGVAYHLGASLGLVGRRAKGGASSR